MNTQDEAYSEALAEIERLKAQHEEMLLKHAREQNVALSALSNALAEIERLKEKIYGLEKLNQMTDEEVIMELKAEIDSLKRVYANEIAQCYEDIRELKTLLTRAADALENLEVGSFVHGRPLDLIAELRKAAQ